MFLLLRPSLLSAAVGFIAAHYADLPRPPASRDDAVSVSEAIQEWMMVCCGSSNIGDKARSSSSSAICSSSSSSSSSADAAFYSGLEDHLRQRGFLVPIHPCLTTASANVDVADAASIGSAVSSSIDAAAASSIDAAAASSIDAAAASSIDAAAASSRGGGAAAADLPSFNQHAAVAKARAMWAELSTVRCERSRAAAFAAD
jgi:hypothetical protein